MSWDDVFTALGLRTLTKETRARVEGHAIRLGLDVEHLDSAAAEASKPPLLQLDPMRLRDAAAPLAAAWFMMRGCTVSFPMEQAVYDLLVQSNREILRVQVKTTTARGATGTVNVARRPYSAQNLGLRMPYDAEGDRLFLHRGRRPQHLSHSESSDRRASGSRTADVQEVHRGERGRVAWCESGYPAVDGGPVAVGVRGLRWRRLVVGRGRLPSGVRGSAGRG